mgnify:CR=1 FL=1
MMGDWFERAFAALANAWPLGAGLLGRLMFHTREAQAGRRRFWGRELLFELPMAIGMSLIGYSLGEWLSLPGAVSAGMIGALAYLGPRAIDAAFDKAAARKTGG